jgi:predicted RNA-binding Zn ribbon-like protein
VFGTLDGADHAGVLPHGLGSVHAGLAARVKALTAAGLAHAIDDGAGSRLRACSRASCGIVFIDTSRNGRRHFCSVRCANHVNVANHRLRRRQALAR